MKKQHQHITECRDYSGEVTHYILKPNAITKVIKSPTKPNYGLTADGYTKNSGAPTEYKIQLEGEKKWRRLMYFCFSNSGSIFVRIDSTIIFVNEHEQSAFDNIKIKEKR